MEQGNEALVRRGIADVQAFWDMLDESVVWDLQASPLPDLDPVYAGKDAVVEASRLYWGTWAEYSVEEEEILASGSCVVVILRERGRGKGSGAPFELLNHQTWTFRDGKVVRWDMFRSRPEALAAAGLTD